MSKSNSQFKVDTSKSNSHMDVQENEDDVVQAVKRVEEASIFYPNDTV